MAEAPLALHALTGVALLALVEGVAWWFEARRSHPPGVPPRTRLATLAAVLAIAGGFTAIVAWAVTLPIGDATIFAALGVASVVLVAGLVLSLGSAASRS